MGGEILQFFVGQYGLQAGNAIWELACVEHDLDTTGSLKADAQNLHNRGMKTLFAQVKSGKYVPRCVLVDTEPTVMDEIRTGNYRSLFNPSQLVNSLEDSASNFARGYFKNAQRLIPPTMDITRRLMEASDDLQAFVFHYSHSGGTGSGFTSSLLEKLNDEYPKKSRLAVSLLPSDAMATCTVESYNAVLSCHIPSDFVDFTILTDNRALLNACTERIGIRKPTVTHLNRVQSQVVSSVLCPLRFGTQLSANLGEILTNLVPYPDAHYVVGALTPLRGSLTTNYEPLSCHGITEQAFEAQNQLISSSKGYQPVYLSCCMFYRGDVRLTQVNNAIAQLKKSGNLPWVDWCPTGFKVAISEQPMTSIPSSYIGQSSCSLLILHNSTIVLPSISRLISEFELLYSRRAFIHWYTSEGMEEAQFTEAVVKLKQLCDEYREFELSNNEYVIGNTKQPDQSVKLPHTHNVSASPQSKRSDTSKRDAHHNNNLQSNWSSEPISGDGAPEKLSYVNEKMKDGFGTFDTTTLVSQQSTKLDSFGMNATRNPNSSTGNPLTSLVMDFEDSNCQYPEVENRIAEEITTASNWSQNAQINNLCTCFHNAHHPNIHCHPVTRTRCHIKQRRAKLCNNGPCKNQHSQTKYPILVELPHSSPAHQHHSQVESAICLVEMHETVEPVVSI